MTPLFVIPAKAGTHGGVEALLGFATPAKAGAYGGVGMGRVPLPPLPSWERVGVRVPTCNMTYP